MLLLLALLLSPPAGDEAAVDYGRDVRPILSRHCFPCHGPDPEAREAKLRLDRWDPSLARRGVLVPGALEDSDVWWRVSSPHDDERMPPPEAKNELSAAQVDVLRRWIEAGATYAQHWAFLPVAAPDVPRVADADGREPLGPIDAFVAARLAEAGLELSPEADRRTLARRVSFDLTGLPPTPEELAAFEQDPRPDAYERLVERLLESPAHAERMALAWMDAARYGDTSVFHADGPRDMWPWRDWVIAAYAENMPFDRFTVEQLAGDLLPDATRAQRIATGFLRNNGSSDEGGAIDEELRVSYMVDRVKTVGNVWLGLSIECAQCHTHKFDPISQRDYYRFFAYFDQSREKGFQTRNGNEPPMASVPSADQERELARLERASEGVREALATAAPPRAELETWCAAQRAELAALETPELDTWRAIGPFTGGSQAEVFRAEYGPEAAGAALAPIQGQEWRARDDWPDGTVHALGLPDFSALYLRRTITVGAPTRRVASLGSDDTLQVWLNGEPLLAKEVGRGAAPDQDRVELDLSAGENVFLMKVVNGRGASGFYFELLGSPLPGEVQAALAVAPEARDDAQRETLRAHYVRAVWPLGVGLSAELDRLEAELAALRRAVPTVMVMEDRPDGRQTYVLDRGQYDAPREDEPVEPGVLAFLLPPPADAPPTRLGLARWLVDPAHPLTARVAVNRYWAMLFGRGLVESVMDFGAQGAAPSHPELLDWLARDFVAGGWDVRRTLRRIVTSRTYRQASRATPELLALDPEDRLLTRAPRRRLQAEFLRDQALAASGLLERRVGGPGVKPYQPEGLWNEVSLNKNVRFQQDHGEALHRRSMYTYWKRSAPPPAMTLFDAPSRERCLVQRQTTNTPLQALVTLNDVQFVEAARRLAARMLAAGEGFDARLELGFELCTGRPPDALRREVLGRALEAELDAFRRDPARAEALLSTGEAPRDATLDPAEHAAWTVLASMLLNLDETLCLD